MTLDLFEVQEPEKPLDASAKYASIALAVPLRRTFTYVAPPSLALEVGMRVAVPFGPRKVAGFVVALDAPAPPENVKVRSVSGILDPIPVFPAELMRALAEAADYYVAPIGEVLRSAAPALATENVRALRKQGAIESGEELKGAKVGTRTETYVRRTGAALPERLGSAQRKFIDAIADGEEHALGALRESIPTATQIVKSLDEKGLVTTEQREVRTSPFFRERVVRDTPPALHGMQRIAVSTIVEAIDANAFCGVLLHGVTGSGKTEVYLHAIEHARRQGRGAILLVPEIALTPQLVSRFRARFGDEIAVLHSGLSDRERFDAWHGLRRGDLTLAVGARSAIFAPVKNLGVIVVDEEHDPSFKQEEGFRYHARDFSLLRASRAGAVCVLGSATPSIEAYDLALRGKLTLSVMPERATPKPLPKVEIVDLARHKGTPSGVPLLSAPLHRALDDCFGNGGQAILFLNRRGFSPNLRCEACNEILECPACSVTLTEHRRVELLRCHYCDFAMPTPEECPHCHERALVPLGLGTEKLEDELHRLFPTARIGRLDRDVATTADRVEDVLTKMRRRELDALVGTQMVTKGHDLPGVTLVGVVLADQSLAFPDFRASERTFQLLAQVAGRAGRGEEEGKVIVQTFQPEHPAIRFACAHDYEGFFEHERAERKDVGYAPFSRLVAIRVDAGDDAVAKSTAESLAQATEQHPAVRDGRVRVLGPATAPIARLRGRFRYRVLLRSADRRALGEIAKLVAARIEAGIAPARATVDVDPVNML